MNVNLKEKSVNIYKKQNQKQNKKEKVVENQLKKFIEYLVVNKENNKEFWVAGKNDLDFILIDKVFQYVNDYLIFSEYSKTKLSKPAFLRCLRNIGIGKYISDDAEKLLYFDQDQTEEMIKHYLADEGVRNGK